MNIIAFVKMKIYLCGTLKAIHNKDYSVVKTFKAGPFRVSPSFSGNHIALFVKF